MRSLMRTLLVFVFLLMGLGPSNPTHAQERLTSVALSGAFNTSSKLFHHPNDPDDFIRSQFLPLNNIPSAGIDVRHTFEPLHLSLGISLEYITKNESFTLSVSESQLIPVKDGFTVIPLELSGYIPIPVGNDRIQVYMGGGAGAYFGSRHHSRGSATAPTADRKIGYGIHVLSGLEYVVQSDFLLRIELKFRDVQFETINRFEQTSTIYAGSVVPLEQTPLNSRINIDGMTFSVGVAFRF